jgi:hypothetical protein
MENKKRSHKAPTREQKLRRILDKIDDVLAPAFAAPDSLLAEQLWNILSALRGPDSAHGAAGQIKDATTAVLRKVSFPKTFAYDSPSFVSRTLAVAENDCAISVMLRNSGSVAEVAGDHFESHIKVGFKALGLKWESPN